MTTYSISSQSGFRVEVEKADSFTKRLLGLMLKKTLHSGHGLLLSPCSGVHTCFMNFAIDIVYLDKDYTVLGKETLGPWRVGKAVKETRMVLELNAGDSSSLQKQDKLCIDINN